MTRSVESDGPRDANHEDPPPQTHIRFDPEGRPWLEGTSIKVMEVVLNHLANGWSAEEISFNHDRRIPLAKIYAAVAYDHDNQEAFDRQIEEDLRTYHLLRSEARG